MEDAELQNVRRTELIYYFMLPEFYYELLQLKI
jgi:hypothetical protein